MLYLLIEQDCAYSVWAVRAIGSHGLDDYGSNDFRSRLAIPCPLDGSLVDSPGCRTQLESVTDHL